LLLAIVTIGTIVIISGVFIVNSFLNWIIYGILGAIGQRQERY
jgi:hypothetical protein